MWKLWLFNSFWYWQLWKKSKDKLTCCVNLKHHTMTKLNGCVYKIKSIIKIYFWKQWTEYRKSGGSIIILQIPVKSLYPVCLSTFIFSQYINCVYEPYLFPNVTLYPVCLWIYLSSQCTLVSSAFMNLPSFTKNSCIQCAFEPSIFHNVPLC